MPKQEPELETNSRLVIRVLVFEIWEFGEYLDILSTL